MGSGSKEGKERNIPREVQDCRTVWGRVEESKGGVNADLMSGKENGKRSGKVREEKVDKMEEGMEVGGRLEGKLGEKWESRWE